MRAPDSILDRATKVRRLCLLALAAVVLPLTVAAQDDDPHADKERRRPAPAGLSADEATKDTPRFPEFPRSENLVKLDAAEIGSRYEYWVDSQSLSVDDTGVVRYTLLMRTPKGAANVLFEGFRCDAKAFKTYAYGTREGTFHAHTSPQWRKARDTGETQSRAYLWLLYHRYFCGAGGERLALKDIRKMLDGQIPPHVSVWKQQWNK